MKDKEIFLSLKECSYIILDRRVPLNTAAQRLQKKLFNWWQEYWNTVLRTLHINERMDPLEFTQQHKINVLLHKEEVVSMHLVSVFDKKDFTSHPYFTKFDSAFIKGINNLNVDRILTLQYLAQNPHFKREKPYIYFPAAIGCLSVLQRETEKAQAVVSVARKDLGVSNALAKINFHSFQDDGVYNNTPVSYQISFNPCPYPSSSVDNLVQYFWQNKIEINKDSNKEVA